LRVWNLSLLCDTFRLTILGTFLTRSGVLDSVHSFTESQIGPWILTFFGLTVVTTLGLIGWRGDRLRSPGRIDSPVSREGAFLANNVLFAAFAFVVLLGTVFPLIVEALNDEQLSIGRPYFDRMTMPLGLALLFMMAVGPVLPWRKASGELLSQRLFWPAWAGAGAIVLAVVLGARGLAPLVAFGLGGFAAGAAVRQVVLATRRQGWRGLVGRANGGMIVHLGVVMIAVAFAASSSFETETELTLDPGDRASVGGHEIEYRGMREVEESNKTSTRAQVLVDGGLHEPALSAFGGGTQRIGTPSIESGPTEDVYLALLQIPDDGDLNGTVVLRVIVQPLIVWLWIGGAVMALGTALAVFPGRRRRNPLQAASAPVPGISHDDRDDEAGPPPDAAAADDEAAGDATVTGDDERVEVEV
jgi:cytochrome c-type biogenesis protein CcmF